MGDSGSAFTVLSPFTLSQRNETIVFGSPNQEHFTTASTVVQKLRNPAGVAFDVITLKTTSCRGVGQVIINIFFYNTIPNSCLVRIFRFDFDLSCDPIDFCSGRPKHLGSLVSAGKHASARSVDNISVG